MKKLFLILVYILSILAMPAMTVNAAVKEAELNYKNDEEDSVPITEKEFYENKLNEQKKNDKEDEEWEQRVFRENIPKDIEIDAPSSIDAEMNVITKGSGASMVEVSIEDAEKYGLDNTIIVQISNDSTGDIYELGAYYENNYVAKINIKPGHYTVIAAVVVNDYTGNYSIPTGQEFNVEKGDASTYTIKLKVQHSRSNEKKKEDNDLDKEKKAVDLAQKAGKGLDNLNRLVFIIGGILLIICIVLIRKHTSEKKKHTNVF